MPHKHVPGLVLHLDPDALRKNGATCSCDDELAVQEQHFFVCVEASAKDGLWVPLYSTSAHDREAITPEQKTGHPKWADEPSYFHTAQIWRASHKAVQLAAKTGHDKSTPKSPNTVLAEYVPNRARFPL